jgi:hypothetical protein
LGKLIGCNRANGWGEDERDEFMTFIYKERRREEEEDKKRREEEDEKKKKQEIESSEGRARAEAGRMNS